MANYTDKQAIDELNRQLDEIDKVRKKPRLSPAFKTWQIQTGELLESVFGRRSRQLKDFDKIAYSLAAFSNQTPESKFDEAFHQGLKSAAIVLSSAIKDVRNKDRGAKPQVSEPAKADAKAKEKEKEPAKPAAAQAPAKPSVAANTSAPPQRPQPSAANNKVFVVYADGNRIKSELTDFLAKIGFNVILVQGKPGRQNDVIDKLEKNPDVSYAVVLLNPAATGIAHDVVFELGMLVGGLGRDRVCGLVTEKLDILANYSGISYLPHDAAGAWKFMMIKQLKTAGFVVDANLAL
ncbi:MAG: nucleotide-binding protein [Gammaproteobacteria bacterium]|jgi:predicted nucleotide-binding protein